MSVTRGAKAIAKEIQRRLLPAYLPAFQQALASQRATEARDRAAVALIGRLASILGVRADPGTCSFSLDEAQGSVSGSLETYDGTRVSMTLHGIPAEQATAICEILVASRAS